MDLGKYKAWFMRLQSFTAPINFIMVLYLYIIQEPLDIPWYVWVVFLSAILALLLVFDILFILPGEYRYTSNKNPEWQALRKDLNAIKNKLFEDEV